MKHTRIVHRLLGILRPLRGLLVFSTLMRVANQALGVALIAVAVWGIMGVVTGGGRQALLAGVILLAALGLLKGVCRYFEQFVGHYVAFRLLLLIRHRLYQKLEALSPSGLVKSRSGDVVTQAVSDIERLEVFYAHTVAPAIVAVIVPALTLAVLARFDWLLALALVPFLLVVGLLIPWAAHRLGQNPARDVRRLTAGLSAWFTDNIQGLREVVVYGVEEERLDEVRRLGRNLGRAQKQLAGAGAVQNLTTEFVIGVAILMSLWLGLSQMREGMLGAAGFPLTMALAISSFVPLLGISNLVPDFELAMSSAGRLFHLLDQPEPETSRPAPLRRQASRLEPSIRFDEVSFSYPNSPDPVLRRLNFHAPAGSLTAIVGESGVGKSTIVNLLLRFWSANQGWVSVGGISVTDWAVEDLRNFIAVAPQRPHLFNVSLRENLLLARPEATQREIEQAARLANIHDFIVSLPRGYHTPAHEAGARLSGGQKQRLSLARAFLKDAPILVLDEATSSLDEENEREIRRALRVWMDLPSRHPRRTVLLIAHKLANVTDAERIYVLQNGTLAESGDHSELLAVEGVYANLFRVQTGRRR